MKFNLLFRAFNLKFKSLFHTPKEMEPDSRFILFPDTPAGDGYVPDFLGRGRIAQEIAATIYKSKGQINFLISGEWGIGKTTVLNLVRKNLKKGIKCVRFSPWKYSGSSEGAGAISRTFITILADEFGKSYVTKDLYIKKQVVGERNIFTQMITLISITFRYLLYLVIIFILLYAIWVFSLNMFPAINELVSNFLKNKDPIAVFGVLSAVLALPPLGQYFISRIREQGEIEKMSAPELFEGIFRELLNKTVRIKWLQVILSFWEETLSKTFLSFLGRPLINTIFYRNNLSFLKQDKLVVFIDDLDRCRDKEIREFLSGMKTFFDHPRVYYIVAADMNKLEGKVLKVSVEGREFLRKIIQIDWNTPYLKKEEVKDYTMKLLKQAGALDKFTDEELEQIISMLRLYPNPRRIKYYLRRLLFHLNIQRLGTL